MVAGYIAAAGSLMSGASSLFGGGGGTSRKRESDSYRLQSYVASEHAERHPKSVVKGLRAAGIHPLYGFNSSPSGGMSFGFGGQGAEPSTGDQMAQMGQGIERAASAYMSREDRLASTAAKALQLENMQLQNEKLRSDIALKNQAGQPPTLPDPYAPMSDHVRATELGSAGIGPLHNIALDEHGDPVRVYNTNELGDNEVMQILHAARYSVPDAFHHINRRFWTDPRAATAARKILNYLKKGGK